MTDRAQLRSISGRLEKVLKPDRYDHTQGVMYTAAALSMRYGEDMDEALLAGLLHDCGKIGTVQEQKNLCNEYGIDLTVSEQQIPSLIHAKLGAYLAEHEYNIADTAVVEAIAWHTTGKPAMNMLEKIIYVADFIEPLRREIPSLAGVRNAAFSHIDKAVALAADATVSYLRDRGAEIDPITIKTYEYYICHLESVLKKK